MVPYEMIPYEMVPQKLFPYTMLEWFRTQCPQGQLVLPSHSDHITNVRNCTLVVISNNNLEIDKILGNLNL